MPSEDEGLELQIKHLSYHSTYTNVNDLRRMLDEHSLALFTLGEENLPPLSTYLCNTVRGLRSVEPPNSFSFRRWRSNLPMDPRGGDDAEDDGDEEEDIDEDDEENTLSGAPHHASCAVNPERNSDSNSNDGAAVNMTSSANNRINIVNFYNNPNLKDFESNNNNNNNNTRNKSEHEEVNIPISYDHSKSEPSTSNSDHLSYSSGGGEKTTVVSGRSNTASDNVDISFGSNTGDSHHMIDSNLNNNNNNNNDNNNNNNNRNGVKKRMRNILFGLLQRFIRIWKNLWERRKSRAKYGTIIGVLLPCLQIVLGVILFLRLPLIIGQAGIGFTLLIAALSILPTFCTVLSLSAIASNGRIPSGGMYFMISRTLGADIGGAIGFMFFLGTAATATLYILGTAETALLSIPELDMGLGTWNIAVLGLCILAVLFLVVFFGLRYVSFFGTGLFVCVIVSILSLFIGIFLAPQSHSSPGVTGLKGSTFKDNWGPQYTDDWDFISLLALFYPSQIGMIAGANRSGDLRQPGTAIPVGTIAALVISAIIYVTCILLFGSVAERSLLVKEDFLPFASLAWPTDWIVRVGILLVSIGAGLQSFTNAPRLFQAIANDGIIPILRYVRDPAGHEPRRAMTMVAFLSSLAMLFRNLDEVAPVISMLVLLCYAFVNLSCLSLSISRAPNWRPHFRFYHWSIAGVGFLANVVTMFLIKWYWALVAFVLSAVLYKYIEYKGQEANWGHGLKGLRYQQARNALLTLDQIGMSAESWRPQVLVLAKSDAEYGQLLEPKLLDFVNQLKKGRGLCILGTVISGSIVDRTANVNSLRELLRMHMKRARIAGFVDPVIAPTVDEGFRSLLQLSGIGNFSPNTVVMGYPSKWQKRPQKMVRFVDMVHQCNTVSKALIAIKNHHLLPSSKHRFTRQNTIDVWWILHDGGLLMLLPFLLQKHKTWTRCRLRVFGVADRKQDVPKLEKDLKRLMYDLRIPAVVNVIPLDDEDLLGYMYHKTLQLEKRRQILEQVGIRDDNTQNKLSSITGALMESLSSRAHTPLSNASTSSDTGRRSRRLKDSKRKSRAVNNHGSVNINNVSVNGNIDGNGGECSSNHNDERTYTSAQSASLEEDDGDDEGRVEVEEEEEGRGGRRRGKENNIDNDNDNDTEESNDHGRNIKEEEMYTYDEKTLMRMKTAIAINNQLKKTATRSTAMVLINLPYPSPDQLCSDYMEFLDTMCEDVETPIMLVRGTGRKVVTHYE